MLATIPSPADFSTVQARREAETVDITRFIDLSKAPEQDATYAVRKALNYCRQKGIKRLTFPRGTYHFHCGLALETVLWITNNDSGIKRVVFELNGLKNFEIDGGGSLFVFHGFLTPFVVDNSKDITLKNLRIDFDRTFHSEGTIIAVGHDSVDLAIGPEYPYKISNGLLTFIGKPGDETTKYPSSALLEFDPKKRETAYMANDYFVDRAMHAVELAPAKIRLQVKNFQGTPGNILVFGAADRLVPGIVIQDSAGIELIDLTINHAGGMGVIAQRSSDLSLRRVKVTPSGDRMVSTTADATHFANCFGKVSLIDCLFENQMDDATNIHGIYVKITQKLTDRSVEVRLGHNQQFGFDFLQPGQKIELVNHASLVTYGELTVDSVERLNSEVTRLSFTTPLPGVTGINDVLAAVESQPEVLVQGCTFRNNRARGLLLGSRRKIQIKDNTFHNPGAAILLEGDGNFWFEQAGVRDLTIQNNTFDNCNFGVWGKAVIDVGTGIRPEHRSESRYNRGIVIEDNLFRVFDSTPLVAGYGIDGLSYFNNRIEKTNAYPAARKGGDLFKITDSEHVVIEP